VEAAAKDRGKLLHARLQQDLNYWKAVGPTLTPNWLDQLVEPGVSLFVKFDETKLLIGELDINLPGHSSWTLLFRGSRLE